MTFLRTVCLLASFAAPLAASPSPKVVEELEVEVTPEVKGTLTTTSSPTPQAVVLLLHGWASQRDEVGNLFQRVASGLAELPMDCLRIDFRGEGERNGHRLTSTFAGRVADAEAALHFLQQRYPDTKIGVVGFSLGGATSLALVGRHPQAVDSLVLWSTSADLAVDFYTDEELKPAIREALETGEASYRTWTTLTLTREHIAGMAGYDLFGPLIKYRGALLGIRGSDDYVTPYESRIFAAANASPEEAVTIGNADHIFNTLDPASTHDERAIELTVRWFEETL